MLKRFVILGLVLLLAGSAGLGWVLTEKRKDQQQTARYQSKYGSQLGKEMEQYDEWLRLPAEKRTALPPVLDEQGRIKTKAQLQQEQQGRLKADLDKLAGSQADSAEVATKAGSDAQALADFLYGDNWQQELNKYKGQQEQKELILNGSIVCTSIGGAIFTGCLLLYTIRLVIKVSSSLGKLLADALADRRQTRQASGGRALASADAGRGSGQVQDKNADKDVSPGTCAGDKPCPQVAGLRIQMEGNSSKEPPVQLPQVQVASQLQASSAEQTQSAQRMADQSKKPLKTLFSARRASTLDRPSPSGIGYRTSGIQHPTAGVKQTTTEAPDPLNNTLIELTQQVAAIREYASTQQDRVQKLQEGYDWNIIRNFCLRVIRCIDNVENRIRERAGQNGEAVHLREIRDELLFALESSGIEQFEPEINSDYQRQEKFAEAVKERESCDDPDLTGRIAKVVRPGYQYFIDDKTARVVRPAMVMLFA